MIDRLDRRAALGAIAGALVGAPAALADQPLPAARDFEVRSPAGRFLARLAVAGKTEMWRLEPRRERLWIAPAFSRVAFVSDVGPTLALCNPGANLLPLEATGASVVVAFWRDGALKREVRLSEVMEPGRLRRTVSHYAWAHLQGFDARGRLRLETVDGERVLLEP